jgi:hypothetical protein
MKTDTPAVTCAQTYDVKVERESITLADVMGPGSGYSVRLRGPVDANWLRCYKRLRVESPSFSRFTLENGCVLFACRTGDALTDVESILRILDALVRQTNELAFASAEPIE